MLELFDFAAISLGFGFLSLLTPCVFPMIPITVSYFTKKSEQDKKIHLLDVFIYTAGIIVTFSFIGLVTAVFFGASQISKIAANPWVNLLIAAIFIVFALNLFGFFEITINHKFINQFQTKRASKRRISTFSMAVIFTLTTFTCTMPFVGTILVSASQGNILFPVIGMFCYGLSFSLPFIFLALFPKFMQKLPHSGDWMYATKITMGFLEMLAALKFISNADIVWQLNLITRPVFLIISSIIFIALGLYFLKIIRFPLELNRRFSLGRLLLAILSLMMAVHLFYAKDGKTSRELEAFLPPPEYGNTKYTSRIPWLTHLADAKVLARSQKKLIFIDFTGYTCINCRWMEQNIFTKRKIEDIMRKKFILVRLYTDGNGPEYIKNQQYQNKKFSTVALPLYALLTPEEQVISTFEGMTRDDKAFINFLHSATSNGESMKHK